MNRYLVFQLYGPLASWGEQAVGKARHSATHPSRSAMLGLLAAALGIKRPDTVTDQQEVEKFEALHMLLADSVGIGIKVISSGSLLKDYQTTQVPPHNKKAKHLYTRRDELLEEKLGTILSNREYRQDAFYHVAIWSKGKDEKFSLETLLQALQKPVFTPYLGRKSCPPALPFNPVIVKTESLKSALDQYSDSIREKESVAEYLGQGGQMQYFWETCPHSGMLENFRTPRYDESISRLRWQFRAREEFTLLDE
ncbi:MAG TPA: type I-E CRISPR-associated protein Cas5/CasD [Deltaproteobacteria bacterium]|nr:MAG: type I-E CRISPR-associated protein Cas5/CasD [Deltaproteobacteria bacterium]HDG96802.1 type I-E CRISPR-associated protein Cas5/CasD [Desulfobacterales bacterium]HDH98341.1 type I-E CRISPR-associated protein Cas5/CasD [Deltaproteobacteria bacterium]